MSEETKYSYDYNDPIDRDLVQEERDKALESFEEQETENIKNALELINTGKWLQLEGSVGRFCAPYIDAGLIIVDEERTEKEGTVNFNDGYGRFRKDPLCKIDWDKFNDNVIDRWSEL